MRNAHTYTLVVCICVSVCVCEVVNCLGKESQRAGRGFPCGGRVHFLARELPYVVGSAQKEKKKKRMLVDAGFPLFLTSFILVFCQNLNKRKESLERSCNGYLPLLALPLIFFLLSR